MKSKGFFTILIVPDQASKVRRLVMPRVFLRGLAAAVVAVGLLFSGLLYGFFHYRGLHVDDSAIREENQRYRREIDQVLNKVASIETYLDRVRRFDQKLRLITNLQDSERHVALGPLEGDGKPKPVSDGESVAALDPEFRSPDLGGAAGSKRAMEKLSGVQESLEKMEGQAAERESSLQDLENKLKDMGAVLRATPAIWPSLGWVTSNFGFRISPFSGTRTMHEGIDVAARPGTPIFAPADGIVTYVGTMGNYGKTIVINHGYGTVTRYGHLSESFVKLGDKVKRRDRIAAIGNTGRSTGPHLHYEVVVNGIPHDPKKYILD